MQGICDILNEIRAAQIQNAAEKAFSVKKILNGYKVEFELTHKNPASMKVDPDVLDKHVEFIQSDAQSMIKSHEEASTIPKMTHLPPSDVAQDTDPEVPKSP